MATREQLSRMLSIRPFRPFVVKVVGVGDFVVKGPELVMCDLLGLAMTLADEQGTHEIDMGLVAVMERIEAPATTSDNGH